MKRLRYSAPHVLGQQDVELAVATYKAIERDKGRLDTREQAKEFLERSRPKKSPTHHLFVWNDKEAAELQRLERARQIIASIRVIFEDMPDTPVRAFPVVVAQGKRGPMPMERVMGDAGLVRGLVEQALADAEAWSRRYARLRDLAALRGVFDAIDAVRAERKKTG